jgi:hypothetical protein
MPATWETRQELLAAAAAAGYQVSTSQLGRLQRAGLLAAPEIKSLGRGRGTESRYPLGSAARLVRVAEIHAGEHRLAQNAWRLWWEDGGAIPRLARELLVAKAPALDVERDRLAELIAGNEAGTVEGEAGIDRLLADAERARLRGPIAEIRHNVGRSGFTTVVYALAAAATGPQSGRPG